MVMPSKPFSIKASAHRAEVDLFIYEDIGIGGVEALEIVEALAEHKDKHVHLRINSGGGDVHAGLGIYSCLLRHPGGVTTHIDGIAASMASVLAVAGNPAKMASTALLMVHNPWTVSLGEANDLRKEADILDLCKSSMLTAYENRTGLSKERIGELMDAETWLDAEAALELGFIDEIEEPMSAAASISIEEAQLRVDKAERDMASIRRKSTIKNSDKKAEVEIETPANELEEVAPVAAIAEPVAEVVADVVAEQPAVEVAPSPVAEVSADIVAELESLRGEITRLSSENKTLEDQVAVLNSERRTASAEAATIVANMTGQAATVQPAPEQAPFDPVEAFKAASKAGDYKLRDSLYAEHHKVIWAAR